MTSLKDLGMAVVNKLHKQELQHCGLSHITMHPYMSSCKPYLWRSTAATYVGMQWGTCTLECLEAQRSTFCFTKIQLAGATTVKNPCTVVPVSCNRYIYSNYTGEKKIKSCSPRCHFATLAIFLVNIDIIFFVGQGSAWKQQVGCLKVCKTCS